MALHNADIAAVIEEIADLLEIQQANPFRVRAYRNAARTVAELGRDIAALHAQGQTLAGTPGIGIDLAEKIGEICGSGTCALRDELRAQVPAAIIELLRIPGLGPKRVQALWRELDVQDLEQLRNAAQAGRIRALPGFGVKIEQHILDAVDARLSKARRFKLPFASEQAEALTGWLQQAAGAGQVVVAGSLRRRRDTVGDLDVLVTAADAAPVMAQLAAFDGVTQVLSSGPTRSSVRLRSGLQIDVRVVEEASFGAALHYFTGSKAHNIHVRRLGQERGLKINEYGVFRGEERIGGATEASVFAAVDLPWIAPELREDRGEIEAGLRGELPRLIELSDLKGDLHSHTRESDGHDSLETMAAAARAQGLQYLAVTEHSQRLTVARGLDPERLARHMAEIDRVNAGLHDFVLLRGIEVDILEDGSLDLPDAVLAGLDVVVAAVHSRFELTREEQTRRILRALENPHVAILAHPTGRLLGGHGRADGREPYDVDVTAVLEQARACRCHVELNAQPDRLDLADTFCQQARALGVLVSIDSDSHRALELANLRYGIGQARRGWLEAKDVLNTRKLEDLWPLLRR